MIPTPLSRKRAYFRNELQTILPALCANTCSHSQFASGAFRRKKRVDRRMAGLAGMMEIRGAAQALAETK